DAQIEFFPPPAVPGYGNTSGFELRLLDKTGSGDFKRMEAVTNQFIDDLAATPEIGNAFTMYDASFPQYLLHVDRDKAAQKKVSVDNVISMLQTHIGSEYVIDFFLFDMMYRVMVQASPEYRAQPVDILHLFVNNRDDEPVLLSAFMSIERVYGL